MTVEIEVAELVQLMLTAEVDPAAQRVGLIVPPVAPALAGPATPINEALAIAIEVTATATLRAPIKRRIMKSPKSADFLVT